MRKVLFITGIRSDFYNQAPIIKECYKSKKVHPILVVAGAHNEKFFGKTINDIKVLGFKVDYIIKNLIYKKDSLFDRAESFSKQLSLLLKIIKKEKPNIIISPYDREESLTTSVLGVYLNIPVFHLGAGDVTKYNVDGVVRSAVDKLSHLHFCTNKKSKNNLLKIGEKKQNIFIVGSTSYERYKLIKKIKKSILEKKFKLKLNNDLILLIYHPVSNHIDQSINDFSNILWAIDKFNKPTIIIKSNSDPGHKKLDKIYKNYTFKINKYVRHYKNIPEKYFVNILRNCKIILGNSSMGVTESAYFNLRAINVGLRQTGRNSNKNIVFIDNDKSIILNNLKKYYFKKKKVFHNLYQNKNAAKKIVNIIEKVSIKNNIFDKHN